MKKFNDSLNWLDAHHNLAYSLLRIYLGMALLVRGWIFLADPSEITTLAGAQTVYMWYSYIIGAHLIGGFMLAVGLLGRIGALIQIPVLIGAVFLIHFKQGLMTVGQSLELTSLTLFLLLVYFAFGSGIFSIDHYLAKRKF